MFLPQKKVNPGGFLNFLDHKVLISWAGSSFATGEASKRSESFCWENAKPSFTDVQHGRFCGIDTKGVIFGRERSRLA